uniref:RRM domain-containing protein n=1 Tax=Xiphophorus couchianus TaxID=32473 RepID=A0A3B5KS14_9TELE
MMRLALTLRPTGTIHNLYQRRQSQALGSKLRWKSRTKFFVHKYKSFSPLVKVLFVRNLANGVTEEILEKSFSQFGKLERVKKLKDYAFVHFEERDGAALEELNGTEMEGEPIEIVFAKPPDQKRKERKAQRQAAKSQM